MWIMLVSWSIPIARHEFVAVVFVLRRAHASTGALSDRFKIANKASVPDINLSPQVLLNCGPAEGFGSCSGGTYTNF
jgi:hypothetical protein